jgi:L-alanine-DL-glutamate epimerase-like enolase superfamily enzyme
MRVRIEAISRRPLLLPLRVPFVIASGEVASTRAVEVEVQVTYEDSVATGLGEAAALPPVTHEDVPDIVKSIDYAARSLRGAEGDIAPEHAKTLMFALDRAFQGAPVARAGFEMALLDAIARLEKMPLYRWLRPGAHHQTTFLTDITLSIGPIGPMVTEAQAWHARGFRCFKVKVGRDVDHDMQALETIANCLDDVTFRIDANAGFTASDALTLMAAAKRHALRIECFEQPCAAGDLDAMARVTREIDVPVIADESVQSMRDFERIVAAKAASGVNLKLAKMGGPLHALRIGVAAKRAGLKLMMGGMVESRLGMTAAAHLAAALGGVDFADLDTAFLLAEEGHVGGYVNVGPRLTLTGGDGLDVARLT